MPSPGCTHVRCASSSICRATHRPGQGSNPRSSRSSALVWGTAWAPCWRLRVDVSSAVQCHVRGTGDIVKDRGAHLVSGPMAPQQVEQSVMAEVARRSLAAVGVDVDAVVDRLVRHLGASRVVLFGSWTRGDPHAGSDLDLFVGADGEETSFERSLMGRRLLRELTSHPGLDPILVDALEWRAKRTLGHRISLRWRHTGWCSMAADEMPPASGGCSSIETSARRSTSSGSATSMSLAFICTRHWRRRSRPGSFHANGRWCGRIRQRDWAAT